MLNQLNEHIKMIDKRSGLKSAKYFEMKVNALIEQGQSFTIIGVSLNDLENICNAYSKKIAHAFLRKLSTEFVKIDKTIIFMGETDMLFLLYKGHDTSSLDEIEGAIRQIMIEKIDIKDHQLRSACSMGVASHPRDGKTIGDLCGHMTRQLSMCTSAQ